MAYLIIAHGKYANEEWVVLTKEGMIRTLQKLTQKGFAAYAKAISLEEADVRRSVELEVANDYATA